MHFRWVPIRRNDWYWLRHHIKVGMPVIVEILVSDSLLVAPLNRAAIHINFCISYHFKTSFVSYCKEGAITMHNKVQEFNFCL